MTKILRIQEGYRMMNSSQCLDKLQHVSNFEERLGMIWNWSKQGVLRSKAFREVMEALITQKAEVRARHIVEQKKKKADTGFEITENYVEETVA